ncbi:MAG: repeat-containing protein, partial [Verrucomicrobiales bacterium]|nr:repeat-containing protein [Verrucomicrobiales bacterium]
RNGKTAVELAQRACELSGFKDAKALGILDAAYAEAGRFKEALETAEKVRALSLQSGQTGLAAAADRRIALYRAGQPFHQK